MGNLSETPMKTIIFAAALLTSSLPVAAVVIANDVVLGPFPPLQGDYVFRLSQSTSTSPAGGLVAVSFSTVGGSNFQFSPAFNNYSIAEEFRLFVAPAGTRFDAAYVSSHTPFFTNAAPAFWSLSIPVNTSLIVGYWDDRMFQGADSADNYGWVRLDNTSSGLVAGAGITAIGGGIIVGTNSQVPEPSAALLALLGAPAIAHLRRCRGRNTRQSS